MPTKYLTQEAAPYPLLYSLTFPVGKSDTAVETIRYLCYNKHMVKEARSFPFGLIARQISYTDNVITQKEISDPRQSPMRRSVAISTPDSSVTPYDWTFRHLSSFLERIFHKDQV